MDHRGKIQLNSELCINNKRGGKNTRNFTINREYITKRHMNQFRKTDLSKKLRFLIRFSDLDICLALLWMPAKIIINLFCKSTFLWFILSDNHTLRRKNVFSHVWNCGTIVFYCKSNHVGRQCDKWGRGCRECSAVRTLLFLAQGLSLVPSTHSSQPPVTLGPGDPMPASAFMNICIKTHTHK